MNQVATQERSTSIESRIDRSISNAISVGTGGITFQNAGEVMEYAKMMAVSGSAVPKHLRGQPGACLGIIDDAIRFQTSPYALARKSFFVNDNLAYEAQVIAGIVNRFAPLRERPDVQFAGDGPDRKCFVTFSFRDGSVRVYESPRLKDIHPKNSPLWKNDPDQQQSYYSLRAGARRYCPEIILGMYDVDEMRGAEMRDITPRDGMPSVMDRLRHAQKSAGEAEDAREGFNADFVTRETETLTTAPNSDDSTLSSQAVSDDAGDPPPSPAELDGDGESSFPSPSEEEPAMKPVAEDDRERLIECARKMMGITQDDLTPNERFDNVNAVKAGWVDAMPEARDTIGVIAVTAQAVIAGKRTRPQAISFIEEMLGAEGQIGGGNG